MSHRAQLNFDSLQRTYSDSARCRTVASALQQLSQIFCPYGSPISVFRDAIVVSLDLEFDSVREIIFEIGITVLDTQLFSSHCSSLDHSNPNSNTAIRTILTNTFYLFRRRRFRSHEYCYGDPISARHLSLSSILLPILTPTSIDSTPRNVILIGHTLTSDISMLARCGFDITSIPNIKTTIDIAPLASHLLQSSTLHPRSQPKPATLSLKTVTHILSIRVASHHNAAHDSLYTMQALLRLFHLHKSKSIAHDKLWTPHASCRDRDRLLLWESQLDALDFVGREAGNVLWVGTVRNRKRRATREAYQRRGGVINGAPGKSVRNGVGEEEESDKDDAE